MILIILIYCSKKFIWKFIKTLQNFNDIKIKDINDNEISLTKDCVIENQKNNNEPLIKINDINNKNEYIFISINELKNKFNNEFKYVKQEGIFSGKGLKSEPKNLQCLFMQIQCEKLLDSNQYIIEKNKIFISPQKEKNNEINNFVNDKEKLKLNKTNESDIEHEYQNMINPYDGIPFKQVRTMKLEEDKNDNNKNDNKLKNIPGEKREIKIFRIRRAVLFKRPNETKEEQEKK